MMYLAYSQPSLADLEALIARVPRFPFSVKKLIKLAREDHFPEEVIKFLKAFHAEEEFEDHDDMSTRFENVQFMEHEAAAMPPELIERRQED